MVKIFPFLLTLPFVFSQVLPPNFYWGTAASAFQIEGAWNISGRGPSIWDYFQDFPGRVYNNETGHIADDFYDLYPSDIPSMVSLGTNAFRLSISWSRLFPTGDINNVNDEGVTFYMDLISALLNAKITPWVNLYHFDLPQAYNNLTNISSWLDPDIPNKFNAYADFCFKTFGHLVKNWITMNEIAAFAWDGYGSGAHAPGRCSASYEDWCETIGGGGNSSTEPYIAAHNALLSHSLAVNTYRTKYKKSQGGEIGIVIDSGFGLPFNTSDPNDVQAVNTYIAFQYGWIADPLVFGRYPPEMTNLVTGGRLPQFNASASAMIKGAYDFLGVNYYTSRYVQYTGIVGDNYRSDSRTDSLSVNATGNQIGPQAATTWLYVYPPGLRGLLKWIKKRYSNPKILVTENGVSCPNESQTPLPAVLNDTFRVNYIYNHIVSMLDSIVEDKVNIHGYFLWSLLDNFEWAQGYNVRFGITYVDYDNNLTRYQKESWYLYQSLINYVGVNQYNTSTIPSAEELIRSAKIVSK